jgi:hypothetical protein
MSDLCCLYVANDQQWFKTRLFYKPAPWESMQNRHATNSLNATFENIFDETPPKRLKHPVFLERKDDPVCRSANARLGSKPEKLNASICFPLCP